MMTEARRVSLDESRNYFPDAFGNAAPGGVKSNVVGGRRRLEERRPA